MSALAYLDTSVVAKRYLREPGSDEFDDFLARRESAAISRLTWLELRCLLARRRRNREIDARQQRRVLAAFEEDVGQGFLEVHPLEDRHVINAGDLLMRLARHPLRTLDCIHLAIATAIRAEVFATADGVLAKAAATLRFNVARFG